MPNSCATRRRFVAAAIATAMFAITASCSDDGTSVDVSAPARVGDLAVSVTKPYAATLSFTAPGNDGSSGRAVSYDVRYATTPIDESTWDAATQLGSEAPPKTAGSHETIEVGGLDANETYYFAVRTRDGAYNRSDISNSPSATTMPEAFAPANYYPVGDGPRGLVAVNVDTDGDLDLVCSNTLSDDISVLANNGDGTFAAAQAIAVSGGHIPIAAGNVDNDSDVDLVVAVESSNELIVLLGDGLGGFTPQTPIDFYQPQAVLIANVGGSAAGDLIAAMGPNVDSVVVFMSNGDGSFAPGVGYDGGEEPVSMVAHDLDGDIDIDIAVGNGASGQNVEILMNNGDGTFVPSVNYPLHADAMSMAVADMDEDTVPDIVVASPGRISILLNDGAGNFTVVASDHPETTTGISVAVGDFDGDGDADVVESGRSGVYLFPARGVGAFWTPRFLSTAPGYRNTIAAANLDGAGLMDIAVTVEDTDSLAVFLNAVTP